MSKQSSWWLIALVGLLLAAIVGACRWRSRGVPASKTLWRRRYESALRDPGLRANLLAFQRHWREVRDSAFATYAGRHKEGIGDIGDNDRSLQYSRGSSPPIANEAFRGLQAEMVRMKDRVLDDLPNMKRIFRAAAQEAGAHVYEAESARDANEYIAELALRKGITLAVKAKSMVSEEIGLNHALERQGVEVVETDLGEWIVQLSGEHPSHMVAPAIHKSRYQIAELFSQRTGTTLSGDDLPGLTAVARRELRQAFLSAGMGITGANALIAETGSVMLVTNEGNGRLVSSLPPIHVVLAGFEKLVPTMADAAVQLRVLGRSASGQPLTSYTTFVTGPDRPEREVHVVLLDNGRSQMLADPEFRDALRCIRCGACADVCPPYQVMGGHVFGHIYTGAIGLVNTPFHHGLEEDSGPQSLCVSCNACSQVCPAGIPLPRQILAVRRQLVNRDGLPWYKRLAFELWSRPRLFDLAARMGSVMQKPLVKDGFLRRLPTPQSLSWRTLPALSARPARDALVGRVLSPYESGPLVRSAAKGLTVAYFIQCVTDRLYPEMAEAAVRILRACGAKVVVPEAQHCCGLTAFDSGDRDRALAMAKQTIACLEEVSADYIVSGAASCVAFIVDEYPHLFAEDPQWLARARRVSERMKDLSTFLVQIARLSDGALSEGPPLSVTYHDFCQSHNVLGIREAPRRLLRDVMGLELREMFESSMCCGFGGAFSLEHPRVSRHIVERKLANVDATQAEVLVTDNPGCIMHLRGSADASGRPLKVMHLAELMAARLDGMLS